MSTPVREDATTARPRAGRPPVKDLGPTHWRGYLLGLSLCGAATLLALGLLERLPPGTQSPDAIRDLGALLTGLCALAGLLVVGRWRRLKRRLPDLAPERRRRLVGRELLLDGVLLTVGAGCGLVYHGLGGVHPTGHRHTLTYLALPPLLFLLLVPRPGSLAGRAKT
jgi:hypothetical protein